MDLNLVEYKGVQIWKNETDVLYALEELTNREFSFGKDSYFFSKRTSMEVIIFNNRLWKLGLYKYELVNYIRVNFIIIL